MIVHSCFSVQNLSHGFGHKAQYVPTTAIHGSGNRHLAPSSTSLFHLRQELISSTSNECNNSVDVASFPGLPPFLSISLHSVYYTEAEEWWKTRLFVCGPPPHVNLVSTSCSPDINHSRAQCFQPFPSIATLSLQYRYTDDK